MTKYFIILALIFLAWCPWLTKDEALGLVDAKVAALQQSNPNLCAMFINRDSIRKVPFGYTEKVSYDCTIADTEYGVSQSTNIVFITFYKELLGVPNKTVARNP